MSYSEGKPPFSHALLVAIETMHFRIAHTKLFLRTTTFRTQGVPMNNLETMKNWHGGGVQGNLNRMLGYNAKKISYLFNKILEHKD